MRIAGVLPFFAVLFSTAEAHAGSAVNSACAATFVATAKLLRTPHRSIATYSFPDTDAAAIVQEALFLSGKTFLREPGGNWSEGVSPQEMLSAYRERQKGASNLRCKYLRDESLNGRLTAVYRIQQTVDQETDVTYLWILKKERLIVSSETEITGGAAGTLRLSIANEY